MERGGVQAALPLTAELFPVNRAGGEGVIAFICVPCPTGDSFKPGLTQIAQIHL